MTYFKDILDNSVSVGLGLWCLTQLSTIFQLIYHILAVKFIGEGNRSSRRKTTDHPQKADKLYHIMLYRVHLAMSGILIHNFNRDLH